MRSTIIFGLFIGLFIQSFFVDFHLDFIPLTIIFSTYMIVKELESINNKLNNNTNK